MSKISQALRMIWDKIHIGKPAHVSTSPISPDVQRLRVMEFLSETAGSISALKQPTFNPAPAYTNIPSFEGFHHQEVEGFGEYLSGQWSHVSLPSNPIVRLLLMIIPLLVIAYTLLTLVVTLSLRIREPWRWTAEQRDQDWEIRARTQEYSPRTETQRYTHPESPSFGTEDKRFPAHRCNCYRPQNMNRYLIQHGPGHLVT